MVSTNSIPKRAANWQPANLTEDRVVQMADGDIFNVITYGRRTMPPYFEQVRIEERWHIVAYLRVLQRAAHEHGGNAYQGPTATERAQHRLDERPVGERFRAGELEARVRGLCAVRSEGKRRHHAVGHVLGPDGLKCSLARSRQRHHGQQREAVKQAQERIAG